MCKDEEGPSHAATIELSLQQNVVITNQVVSRKRIIDWACISLFVACETIYCKKESTNMYNTGMRVVSGGQYVCLMTFLDFALTIAQITFLSNCACVVGGVKLLNPKLVGNSSVPASS